MGKIVTVHGTFAHDGEATRAIDDLGWWQPNSPFMREAAELVESARPDGSRVPAECEPFVWNGENSEQARRAAGKALLERLALIEQSGEPYCLVGHSHGGSVISNALLEAAGQRRQLRNLKSWITVGTPFVDLHKIPNLFSRLTLVRRVILIASLMLFFMFLCFLIGQLFGNSGTPSTNTQLRMALAGAMMSVPAILTIAVLWYLDWRGSVFYRGSTIRRARDWFGSRWISLWHANDEAVQGLRSLRQAKFKLFAPEFAWQRMTLIAAFALPVAYLYVANSPRSMVGLTNFIRATYYKVDDRIRLDAYDKANQAINKQAAEMAKQQRETGQRPEWRVVGEQRRALNAQYPDNAQLSRVLRFEHQFLYDDDGNRCPGDIICGRGKSFSYNTKLLLHLVTDNVTGALINNNTRYGLWESVIDAAIPAIIVPIASIVVALLLMLLIRWVAYLSSQVLASMLNSVTLGEIKREIYGNDTGGEIAVGAEAHPNWLTAAGPSLPAEVADRLTQQANTASIASIAKFRNAISDIVLAEGRSHNAGLVTSFLTWRELIHTSYFELPEFRKLVVRAVSESDGFGPSSRFAGDPDYPRTTAWLAAIRPKPATAATGSARPPAAAPVAAQT